MRCSKVRELVTLFPDHSLPADLAAHLAACPACRLAYERTESVRKLVALKRHEQPDAAFEARSLAAIRQRIAEQNVASEGDVRSLWDLLGAPLTSFRLAAVAAVAVLLVMNVFFTQNFPSVQTALPSPSGRPAPSALASASTNPGVPLLMASNAEPQGVQYGPVPSTLVDFKN